MSNTTSQMLPLGTTAPDFKLLDTVSNSNVSLADCKGLNGTVIMFICNHCPFVMHINSQLVRLAKDFKPKGIEFIAISSNDVERYPEDAPDKMAENAKEQGYIFPYLYDSSQQIAKAYHAVCTPDFFLFDDELKLVYRGQLDDSRPGNGMPLDGTDIRMALNALMTKQPISSDQKPSLGCNIKWKPEMD